MERKRVCPTELAYVLGMITLAIGTALMERANFGMSMVVAPAYLLHLKISQFVPAFSFGAAEYVFQAIVLAVLSVVMRKCKRSYLFSFVSAVVWGFTLDGALALIALLPFEGMAFRAICYVVGLVVCSLGVAFFFRSYITPAAYELFVKEYAEKTGKRIDRVKTAYDCASCLVGVALSFAFFGFGRFEGVKLGTILCALVNGFLIGRISKILEKTFEFKDVLPLRKYFEK